MSILRTSTPQYSGEAKTLTSPDREGPLDWLANLFRSETPRYHKGPDRADGAQTDEPADVEQSGGVDESPPVTDDDDVGVDADQ